MKNFVITLKLLKKCHCKHDILTIKLTRVGKRERINYFTTAINQT